MVPGHSRDTRVPKGTTPLGAGGGVRAPWSVSRAQTAIRLHSKRKRGPLLTSAPTASCTAGIRQPPPSACAAANDPASTPASSRQALTMLLTLPSSPSQRVDSSARVIDRGTSTPSNKFWRRRDWCRFSTGARPRRLTDSGSGGIYVASAQGCVPINIWHQSPQNQLEKLLTTDYVKYFIRSTRHERGKAAARIGSSTPS